MLVKLYNTDLMKAPSRRLFSCLAAILLFANGTRRILLEIRYPGGSMNIRSMLADYLRSTTFILALALPSLALGQSLGLDKAEICVDTGEVDTGEFVYVVTGTGFKPTTGEDISVMVGLRNTVITGEGANRTQNFEALSTDAYVLISEFCSIEMGPDIAATSGELTILTINEDPPVHALSTENNRDLSSICKNTSRL